MTRAEVTRDRRRVTRAGVRPRERPAADLGIREERVGFHQFDERRALSVPQLPDVVFPFDAVDVRRPKPAEHDVACGLHEPLALNHTLSVVIEVALLEMRLED